MRFRGHRKPEIPYDTVQYQNPYETFGTFMQMDPVRRSNSVFWASFSTSSPIGTPPTCSVCSTNSKKTAGPSIQPISPEYLRSLTGTSISSAGTLSPCQKTSPQGNSVRSETLIPNKTFAKPYDPTPFHSCVQAQNTRLITPPSRKATLVLGPRRLAFGFATSPQNQRRKAHNRGVVFGSRSGVNVQRRLTYTRALEYPRL